MVGKSISQYRIIEKLGQGGMGEGCRARHTHLARDLAVKILPGFTRTYRWTTGVILAPYDYTGERE